VSRSYECSSRKLMSCPFLFQAGDGIRDFHVTGVQTCALPIYAAETCAATMNPARSCHDFLSGYRVKSSASRARMEPVLRCLRSRDRKSGAEGKGVQLGESGGVCQRRRREAEDRSTGKRVREVV